MPPRKKRAPAEEADDDVKEDNVPKKAQKADADDDVKDIKKKSRAKKEKDKAMEEPHTALEGPAWTIHPPYLLHRTKGQDGGKKIAAFDLDGTLVTTKRNAPFAANADDWKFFNKQVPKVLKDYAAKGYKIVVFSNQGGIGKQLNGAMSVKLRQRAENIFEKIDVDATILYAAGKENEFRKPEPGMWNFFVEHLNHGVQPEKSACFFVGDAAGRPEDINSGADSDRKFAENAGIAFKTPEEVFGEGASKKEAPAAAEGTENHNAELSAAFEQLADNFDRKGEGFKARAFRKSAGIIAGHSKKVESGKELKNIAGIGKATMDLIDEFITTGTLQALEEAGVSPSKSAEGGAKPKSKGDDAMALKFL